jgi:thioredoxin reductase
LDSGFPDNGNFRLARSRTGSRWCHELYDVAIIGGGAAGLSAALVLSRARRKVVVLDDGNPRNAPARTCTASCRATACRPPNSSESDADEVARYGGEVVQGAVTDVVPDGSNGFWALLAGGRRIRARRLLVTTGPARRAPGHSRPG